MNNSLFKSGLGAAYVGICWYGKYCIMEIDHDKCPLFIHDDFLSHKLVMPCESNKLLVNSQLLKEDIIYSSCRTKRKV